MSPRSSPEKGETREPESAAEIDPMTKLETMTFIHTTVRNMLRARPWIWFICDRLARISHVKIVKSEN